MSDILRREARTRIVCTPTRLNVYDRTDLELERDPKITVVCIVTLSGEAFKLNRDLIRIKVYDFQKKNIYVCNIFPLVSKEQIFYFYFFKQ